MKKLWTSKDVEKALGVKSACVWSAGGVSIDSRTIAKGDLFFALIGENTDGHKYLNAASEKGASAAIVSYIPKDFKGKMPLIKVKDTLAALVDMAKFRRKQVKAKFVGITGSVGKTSVKEGIAAVLKTFGKMHTSVGNFNNHIGMPLSMCRMPLDTEFGVFEMGMSSAGEISHLSKIVQPDVSVITNIKPMHIEFFESIDGIAHAKSEIFDGMKSVGVAILPKDSEQYKILLANAKKKGLRKILSVGLDKTSNIMINTNKITRRGLGLSITCDGKQYEYSIPAFGAHQALNSAFVFSVCAVLGLNLSKALKGISKIAPLKGRGKILNIKYKNKKFTLIDDSYNAGPDSMKAAFKVLAELKKQHNGRAVALLGDMLELGKNSRNYHEGLAKDLLECRIDRVFTSGKNMKNLTKKLPVGISGGNFTSPKEILPIFQKYVADGDIVLVKGSNGSKMWGLVDIFLGS